MSLLHAEGLHAGYGGVDILQGVGVAVEAGEVAVIVGANGAGKSTLMKALFGLVPVRVGAVRLDGAEVTNTPPERLVRRGIAYVPQERNVFATLSVAENLEMGAFVRRGPLGPLIEQVYGLFPPLRDKRRQAAGELSGGQRQMVAMGRALMLEPRILMLDEPTAGLSPRFQDEILAKVAAIARTGVAVLMVEQNARQALEIADRGYVLQTGRNRFTDTGANLLANREVADSFLGG